MFGRHPRLKLDPFFGQHPDFMNDTKQTGYMRELRQRLNFAYQKANKAANNNFYYQMANKAANNKLNYDLKVRSSFIELGERVLVR